MNEGGTTGTLTLSSPTGNVEVEIYANAIASGNTIKFGDSDIDKLYFGDTEVDKIYFGSELVYGGTTQTYSITATLENCSASSTNPTTIEQGSTATLVYTANTGYKLTSSSITSLVGATQASWTLSGDVEGNTGTLILSNPTANVSFIVSSESLPQLSAPTNLAVSGTTVTFNPSENATSYEVYANGTLIGEKEV